MELDNVKQKIRALANMTVDRGCSEAESMNAARLIGNLLKNFDLTLNEVLIGKQDCIKYDIFLGQSNKHPIASCLVGLAKFAQCKVWNISKFDSKCKRGYNKGYSFFGMPADIEMVKYLYDLIFAAIQSETKTFKSGNIYSLRTEHGYHGRAMVASFQRGMVSRIYNRLIELDTIRREESESETVIVPISNQLNPASTKCVSIVLIKQNKVESDFAKIGIKLSNSVTSRYQVMHHTTSYAAGYDAGNKLNLSRPLSGGVSRLALTAS